MNRMDRIARIAALALTLLPAALKAETRSADAPLMPADTLWACYVPGSGSVYRIRTADAPDSCTKSKHVAFSWETGPSEQPGRILSMVRRESDPIVLQGPGDRQSGSAHCNPFYNEIAVGGGIQVLGGGTRVYFVSDHPGDATDGWVRWWYGTVETPPDVLPSAGYAFQVYVICAQLST